ncbi:tyrosine-type recombinase/integrase [Mycoplasma sp. 480]|uniref:tyrosine-type recombinase/integrase n=1 Tax=Mycoplasma sp. 480 TaxID=3440155 RepID=UPI003F514892
MKVRDFLEYCTEINLSKNTIRQYEYILGDVLDVDNKEFKKVIEIIIDDKKGGGYQHTLKDIYHSFLKYTKDEEKLEKLSKIKLKPIPLYFRAIITKEELYEKTTIKTKRKTEIFYKTIIRFLFETGIRIGELKHLNIRDGRLYTIGKGNRERQLFYKYETLKIMFENWDKYKNAKPNTVAKQIKKILGKIYSPHSLRRSFASFLLKNDANPKMVQMLMGHIKITTTFKYLHFSERENQDMYNKIFYEE